MTNTNFLFSGGRKTPRKLLDHCVVCSKKKDLVYYAITNDFLIQICHKCLDAIGVESQ